MCMFQITESLPTRSSATAVDFALLESWRINTENIFLHQICQVRLVCSKVAQSCSRIIVTEFVIPLCCR